MKSFKNTLIKAKFGNKEALLEIVDLYKAAIYKKSIVNGRFDADLNQLLLQTLMQCILKFKIF